MQFDDVWYASESRLRSRSKVFVYDDVGTLTLDCGNAAFQGLKMVRALSELERPQLVRQSVNWVAYLAVNILLLPVHAMDVWVLQVLLRLDVWPFYVGLVVLCNVLGLVVGFSTKWIRISGKSETGEPSSFFIADGTKRGWGGVAGGTRRLFEDARRLTRRCS